MRIFTSLKPQFIPLVHYSTFTSQSGLTVKKRVLTHYEHRIAHTNAEDATLATCEPPVPSHYP